MKKTIYTFAIAALTTLAATAQQTMWVHTGQTKWAFNTQQVAEMPFADASTLTVQGKTFSLATVDSIVVNNEAVADNNIFVQYSGESATVTVSGNIAEKITTSVSGAHVTVTQDASVDKEYTYTLSGASLNGSFTQKGEYKSTLILNGVSLTNPSGGAITISTGKRVAVVLNKGTENTFVDGVGGSQKAAVYFSGHPEFEGAGTLNVTGNSKHAISAKEYLQLKKSVGTINILGAESDGIHCGKGKAGDVENNFFQMNGGNVTISGVKGDCVDADDYGCIYLKGGKLNITVSADDVTGIKADSVLTMSGGEVTMNVSGRLSQGIRAAWMATFSGGSIAGEVSGDGSKAISGKCFTDASKTTLGGGDLNFEGTNVTLALSGKSVIEAGDTTKCMGIKADKNMTQSAGDILITVSGDEAKAVDVEGNFTRTGGTLEVTSSTKTPAVKTNGNFVMEDGELTLICTGEEANALSSDGNISITGGSVEIRCSGAGSKGIKADGDMTIGEKGKDGPVMIVHTTGDKKTGTSGGNWGGGWNPPTRPGGGGTRPGESGGSGGSPKAIKVMGIFYMYSGKVDVSTSSEGGEGIESKNTMYFDGGDVVSYCYDDCINCTGKIYVRGARLMCYSNGNDAIDSNANTTGSFQISDGVVVAVTSKGGAEMGIDADGNSRLTVTGGYLFTGGGNQGGGSSALGSATTQGYYWMTGKSLSSANYYTLADASGNNIFTVKLPCNVNNTYSLISAPQMKKGSSYTLKSSTTAPTDATSEFQGFYLGSTAQGTTTVATFTAQ
ncbi:MAG: carbohydrate-binding domain-containing protein [Bacteroidales bacterium]|nr:carbohydrate-binding domain-containing protein [Bacteroidales bacterium]